MSYRIGSNVSHGTVSVGTTAVKILAGKTLRKSAIVQNVHATNNLFIGNTSSVTTSNGLKLAPTGSLNLDDYNGDVFGIASAADTDIRLFEVF